jgi:hypothetical protein
VLDYFNSRMDESGAKGEWSVDKVLAVVTSNARAWRGTFATARWRAHYMLRKRVI